MDQFYINLDNFNENLELAIKNFSPRALLINPKDVYHDNLRAKHHNLDLEDKVVHFIHNEFLLVNEDTFQLDPSVAVVNYLRGKGKDGFFAIADSTRNRNPDNKELPPVKYSQLRFLSEYNGIPHSFELQFFGKFPLKKDGTFMDGNANYWKIDEERII